MNFKSLITPYFLRSNSNRRFYALVCSNMHDILGSNSVLELSWFYKVSEICKDTKDACQSISIMNPSVKDQAYRKDFQC